jgi:hypothetical protein
MKEPNIFSPNEWLLDPFIVAADTDSLDSACDLLFIHGNDLTWGRNERGLFLAGVETDESFEEVVQVVEARSKINFTSLAATFIRQLQPQVIELVAGVVPKLEEVTDEGERENILNSAVASFAGRQNMSQFDKVLPEIFGVEQWLLLADAISSSLVRGAVSLRQRQLAATGMSEDGYGYMLYALRRLGLCEQIVRIAYPADSLDFETSLTSKGGFKATGVTADARVVEILRLAPALATLKRGQDNALALFIAGYINRHHPGQRRAFPCAYYGQQNEPELDVVVPALGLGFEVKLYQAPFAQTGNKLEKLANDLRRQLPAYFERGCLAVYYVTNLPLDLAETVLQMAQGDQRTAPHVELIAGGVESLTPALDSVVQALGQFEESVIEQRVQERVAAPAGKRKGTKKATKKAAKKGK